MTFRNLTDIARTRAEQTPDKLAYAFINSDESSRDGAGLSYAELDTAARSIGATLQQLVGAAGGPYGERAVLVYPAGLDFVTAFLGCQYAGVVAVPALPPNMSRLDITMQRLLSIVRDAAPAVLLTTSSLLPALRAAAKVHRELARIRWQATDRLDHQRAQLWRDPQPAPEALSFLQYTSGSTSAPKGVMVSHRNLLTNLDMLHETISRLRDYELVSWLPLFHDMGLIGVVLHGLYAGATTRLMAPRSFIKRPIRWLRALSGRRRVVSGGPNFAYDLCLRRITAEQRRELDLSGWQIAFSGAETVRRQTLERFHAAFRDCGLRREALLPCYGLAEATLVVSARTPGQPYRWQALQREAFEQGRAQPASDDAAASVDAASSESVTIVSCGDSKGHQQIAIVDPHTRARCADGVVGEIWIRGGNVAAGYWGQADKSRETFAATTEDGEGPFLRSGDLGYLRAGQLYVTGRIKELILVRGRCLYPQDVELLVDGLADRFPEIRPGCNAAFAIPGSNSAGERLGLVAQINRNKNPRHDAGRLIEALQALALAQLDVSFSEIALVKGGVPKTSSGKKMRVVCARMLATDGAASLLPEHHWIRGGGRVQPADPRNAPAAAAQAPRARPTQPQPTRQELVDLMVGWIAEVEAMEPTRVSPRQPLSDFGLDSLAAVTLVEQLEERLDTTLNVQLLKDHRTIDDVAAYLLREAG